jgi:hypothetical protein
MSYINKAAGVLRKKGFVSLIKEGTPFIYDRHIAPRLPKTGYAKYNGVSVKAARCFDSILPWRNPNRPHYESGLISGLNEHVCKGDNITIVGGGWGVTTVKAGQNAGESGKITVYEGSLSEIDKIMNTIAKNNVFDRTNVMHAIVGQKKTCVEKQEVQSVSPLKNCQSAMYYY